MKKEKRGGREGRKAGIGEEGWEGGGRGHTCLVREKVDFGLVLLTAA